MRYYRNRTGSKRDNQNKIGPEWHVPPSKAANRVRTVRVIRGEAPEVFTEGGGYALDGDMEAMTTREARAFAMALLAAADWADGQDVVGQRRVEKQG